MSVSLSRHLIPAGLEPATFCLGNRRSYPTELRDRYARRDSNPQPIG